MTFPGLVYERLRIRNSDIYASADIDLDYKGITIVYGLNKDAGGNSTNAAGKSRLFGYLPEILFNTSPLVSKRDKRQKGTEALGLRRGDKKLVVKRVANKGKEKTSLFLNGKALGTRTIAYTQSRLMRFCDRTEEEFFTLDYLDSSRPSILQRGTTAQRRAFLIDLFRLNDIDSARLLFIRELRGLDKNKAVFRELKTRYAELKRDVVGVDVDKIRANIERTQARLEQLNSKIGLLSEQASALEVFRAHRSHLRALRDAGISYESNWGDQREGVERSIQRLEVREEAALDFEAQSRAYSEWKVSNEKALKALRALGVSSDDVEEIRSKAEKAKQAQQDLEYHEDQLRELQDSLPKRQDVDVSLVGKSTEALEVKAANLKHLIDLKENLSGRECPTCKQDIPSSVFKGISAQYERTVNLINQIEEANEARASNLNRKKIRQQILELENKLVGLRDKYKRLRPYIKAIPHVETLRSKPRLTKDKPRYPLSKVRRRLKRLNQVLVVLNTLTPLQDKILQARQLTEEQRDGIDRLPALRDKVVELAGLLPTMQSTLDSILRSRRELRDLRGKLEPLSESIANEDALKFLVEAYGNDGIKKLRLRFIAKYLEDSLNKFSKFVFSESYSFKINVAPQFEIWVQKRYASGTKTTEVKRLSGAESRMFNLLLVMSFVSLMPAKHRSNLLILDEPSANMGEEMRTNFWKFLPVLNKVIPHIIVLTPNSDEGISSARCFTAVKQNGMSRLVEGRLK